MISEKKAPNSSYIMLLVILLVTFLQNNGCFILFNTRSIRSLRRAPWERGSARAAHASWPGATARGGRCATTFSGRSGMRSRTGRRSGRRSGGRSCCGGGCGSWRRGFASSSSGRGPPRRSFRLSTSRTRPGSRRRSCGSRRGRLFSCFRIIILSSSRRT